MATARVEHWLSRQPRRTARAALQALANGRWAADNKRAWAVGELNLSCQEVSDLSVLVGSRVHTLNLAHTRVMDVFALAGCPHLRNLRDHLFCIRS